MQSKVRMRTREGGKLAGGMRRLLTQRQPQSPCKVQGAFRPPEARQLRLGQRLGQLEDATRIGHESTVFDVPTERVVTEAADTRVERLLAVNMRGFEAQSPRKGQALGKVAGALQ